MLHEYRCGTVTEDSLFVACLYIVPDAQRQGIGQRLLARVEALAGQDEFCMVETIARQDSADNPSGPLQFWMKNGYTMVSGHEEYALVRKKIG